MDAKADNGVGEQDRVWSLMRRYVSVLGVVLILRLVYTVAFSLLSREAYSRLRGDPAGSRDEYPAWEAEAMRFEVAGDGFTCVDDMPDGSIKRLRLGWLP